MGHLELGFYFIPILLVLSAVVAYIADKLGKKAGKKKLSIFGLRPKHTATFMSVSSGILIAAITVVVMLSLSQNARVALFGLQTLKEEISVLTKEKNNLAQEKDRLLQEYNKSSDELKNLKLDLDNVNNEKRKLILDTINLKNENKLALSHIKEMEYQKSLLDEKIASLNSEKENLLNDISSSRALLDKLKTSIQSLRTGKLQFEAHQIIAQTIIQGGDKTMCESELNDFIQRTNSILVNELGLKNTDTVLFIPKQNIVDSINLMARNNIQFAVRILSEGNVVVGEKHILASLQVFENNLVFRKDETIVSAEIDPNLDSNLLLAKLGLLLQETNHVAKLRGIVPDPLTGTVGNVSYPVLYNAIRNIKNLSYQSKVKVSILAAEDTYAIGPLHIQIMVN
ncbi:hypothetical protein Thena_1791 [Thermodesulfobium narugense DSM 14796]|uniref:DUF3084 domain-containing protein n=1 Tax=Thermodesulfobium narugense DSM 14796 TaxID=747365 RepID=M1E633_9BACT|nr:DUF3084 domain-containing protein [Thermodesulfobium narugense]AEE15397.1 hypothetical protein Thena_1791 [Thermodesulfobium narugense DSM 14796]